MHKLSMCNCRDPPKYLKDREKEMKEEGEEEDEEEEMMAPAQ